MARPTIHLCWFELQVKNPKDPDLGRRKEAIEGDGHGVDPEVEVTKVQSSDVEGMCEIPVRMKYTN